MTTTTAAGRQDESAAAAARRAGRLRISPAQGALHGALVLVAIFMFVPIFMMLSMSLKSNAQIYTDFWGPPRPWMFENYAQGGRQIYIYIVNTLVPALSSVVLVVLMATLAGYAFSRLEFPGRELFFTMIIVLLMIPSILTLIPTFVLVKQMGLIAR